MSILFERLRGSFDVKRGVMLAVTLLSGIIFTTGVQAQAYPSKPLRIIVPFAAGGPLDTVARIVGQRMSTNMGQSVNIDNRPGAGAILGAEVAAKAPADGYTLLVAVINYTVLPAMGNPLPYDLWRDFAPVSMGVAYPIIVVANPGVPVNSLKDLVAYAKANPGKLSYGSAGTGGGTHLAGELLKGLVGIDIVHIPYKGSAPAMTDLLGGQVQLMFADPPTALPQVKAGKVKALAVAQSARSALAPDIPSATEAGFPAYDAYSWGGFVVPAATPADIVARLNREIVGAMNTPETRDALLARGAEPHPSTPEQFAAFMRAETTKWAKVVKDSNIKAD